MIIELNANHPGGHSATRAAFSDLWGRFVQRAVGEYNAPEDAFRMRLISRNLYQCILPHQMGELLLSLDRPTTGEAPVIHRLWPDYALYPQIDRSASTVKVDAAWRSYMAKGSGIVWAVVDTGIDAQHPHFAALELSRGGQYDPVSAPLTGGLHRDFSALVQPRSNDPDLPEAPLMDEDGHGTHVAGIISGECPSGLIAQVASSDEPADGGFVTRAHVAALSGMAPECELVSLKVFRRINGLPVTSSAAVIAALEYIRTEVNTSRSAMRVHGVNLSLGCEWDPSHYAAGQSPLCQVVNELVASGVIVVISAGNTGKAIAPAAAKQSIGVVASITEPGHAAGCITVGSTHRDAPHVFGVSWTSSKGPTLDGRSKPDVVAPGEWICSAATGVIRTAAHFDTLPAQTGPAYAELSGTSMAAPHVSGVLAGFLSRRPEYIGRPAEVKDLLTSTAVDLGRDRYLQGAGLVDAARMLADG